MDWLWKQRGDVTEAFNKAKGPKAGGWVAINLTWEKLVDDRWVLNIDESVNWANAKAGSAGVLRDANGHWKGGFTSATHTIRVAYTEAWALRRGLEWACG